MTHKMENEIIEAKHHQQIEKMANECRLAIKSYMQTTSEERKDLLLNIADEILSNRDAIISANQKDMALAKDQPIAFQDRLKLDEGRIEVMAQSVRAIADLQDPIGQVMESWQRPNGLIIERIRNPIGLLGVIFEARPNVVIDAAALALKSGNGAILRGGSASLNSAKAIAKILNSCLQKAGQQQGLIQIIEDGDRGLVGAMLQAQGLIDVIIPRGGKALTGRVMREARVPVYAHLDGVVHLYIHDDADLEQAINIIENAKMRRTGICGALECLVVHQSIASQLLPPLVNRLRALGCRLLGEDEAIKINPFIEPATKDDYGKEFLDAIMAIKIVASLDEAIAFINQHNSQHTDGIISKSHENAKRFFEGVDSAIRLHNASTQFADGGEFGMGAEIGIATGRLHARGPIGVEQLTCFHYRVQGSGQIRP